MLKKNNNFFVLFFIIFFIILIYIGYDFFILDQAINTSDINLPYSGSDFKSSGDFILEMECPDHYDYRDHSDHHN